MRSERYGWRGVAGRADRGWRPQVEQLENRWLMATADPDDTIAEATPLNTITTTPVVKPKLSLSVKPQKLAAARQRGGVLVTVGCDKACGLSLSPKQGIAVVRIGGRLVAVSVGEGGVNHLFQLDEAEVTRMALPAAMTGVRSLRSTTEGQAAAAPDELPVPAHPRVDDPILRVTAKRALHRAPPFPDAGPVIGFAPNRAGTDS